jgi:hypothetical protein
MTANLVGIARRSIINLLAVILFLSLAACNDATGVEGGDPRSGDQHWFHNFRPAGGWHPDDGGVFHWWNPNCFPRSCALDDYCRKPIPKVCWPPYPPYYIDTTPQPIGYGGMSFQGHDRLR